MKYYIIAGEASGDLHGSNLIKQLLKLDPQAQVRCWGGNKMQAEGALLVKHYKDLAFMGFIEVIKNLPTILNNLRFCKKDISDFKPDVVVLIDYPGFNIRIAEWAKKQRYKIVYYISPQVWAWKENRVKTIRKTVDKMLVILPFEKAFYQKWDYEVEYVGHPLIEIINNYKEKLNQEPGRNVKGNNIIALLPGSRKQEIEKKLPIMLSVTRHFPAYEFIVAKAPSLPVEFYDKMLAPYPAVQVTEDNTYGLLSVATAALVTSGTATLETALFAVPQVICYKGSPVSYWIARRLIKIKFIGLVNLIMNKEVVKELIQDELTEDNLLVELGKILNNKDVKQQIHEDYRKLSELLRAGGHASAKAAQAVYNLTQQ